MGGDSFRQEERREQQVVRDVTGQSTYQVLQQQQAPPAGPEGREASSLGTLTQQVVSGELTAVEQELIEQVRQQYVSSVEQAFQASMEQFKAQKQTIFETGGIEAVAAAQFRIVQWKQLQLEAFDVAIQSPEKYPEWLKQHSQEIISLTGIKGMASLSKLADIHSQIEQAAQAKVRGETITAIAIAAGIGATVAAPIVALSGAAAGATFETVKTGIMEGKLPTAEQLITTAGFSAAGAAVVSAATPVISEVASKVASTVLPEAVSNVATQIGETLTSTGLSGVVAREALATGLGTVAGGVEAAVKGEDILKGAAAGALAGAAAGAVFEVADVVVGGLIRKEASEWLTEKYLQKGPLEWKGVKEEFVMRVTGAQPKPVKSIVDIPDFPEPTAISLFKQQQAWELAESPGTSAYLATKYVGGTGESVSEWVMEHWLKRVTGGLSYALVQPELALWKPAAGERQLPQLPQLEQQPSVISPAVPIFAPSLQPSKVEISPAPVVPPTPVVPATPTPVSPTLEPAAAPILDVTPNVMPTIVPDIVPAPSPKPDITPIVPITPTPQPDITPIVKPDIVDVTSTVKPEPEIQPDITPVTPTSQPDISPIMPITPTPELKPETEVTPTVIITKPRLIPHVKSDVTIEPMRGGIPEILPIIKPETKPEVTPEVVMPTVAPEITSTVKPDIIVPEVVVTPEVTPTVTPTVTQEKEEKEIVIITPSIIPEAAQITETVAEIIQQPIISSSPSVIPKPKLRLIPDVHLTDLEEEEEVQPIIVPTPPEPIKEERKLPAIVPTPFLSEEILLPRPVPTLPREEFRGEPAIVPAILPGEEIIFEQAPVQVQKQEQVQVQIQQTEIVTQPTPTPVTPTPSPRPIPPLWIRSHEGSRIGDVGRLIFGGQYVKLHQIALPKQVVKFGASSSLFKIKRGKIADLSVAPLVLGKTRKGKRSRSGFGLVEGGTVGSLVFGKSKRGNIFGGSTVGSLIFGGSKVSRRRGSKKSWLKGSVAEVIFK
jgi:hypothetical protein